MRVENYNPLIGRCFSCNDQFNYKWASNTIQLIEDEKSGMLQMMGLQIGLCYIVN